MYSPSTLAVTTAWARFGYLTWSTVTVNVSIVPFLMLKSADAALPVKFSFAAFAIVIVYSPTSSSGNLSVLACMSEIVVFTTATLFPSLDFTI